MRMGSPKIIRWGVTPYSATLMAGVLPCQCTAPGLSASDCCARFCTTRISTRIHYENEGGNVLEKSKNLAMDIKRHRSKCSLNLKMLGFMCAMYAQKTGVGMYPPLDPRPGFLTFKRDFYSEHFASFGSLLCPSDTSVGTPPDGDAKIQWYFDHSSYWYLGYAVPDEASGLAFVDAYRNAVTRGWSLERDLPGVHGKIFERLHDDMFWSSCRNTRVMIPVAMERPGHHEKGAHVLYLPGSVQFVRLGKYPLTKKFIEALSSLDALRTG
ncbi:MAG: hypothetical protein QG656_2461 [Candidatus Hydrogenedentes bacterium]|nr:hypothetical protein [Candidatus Hydrogenedentota bacterium]